MKRLISISEIIEIQTTYKKIANDPKSTVKTFKDTLRPLRDKYGLTDNDFFLIAHGTAPLEEIAKIEVAADPNEFAYWKDRSDENDSIWCNCSKCGAMFRHLNTVEIGINDFDYIKVNWHYCPKCGSKMLLKKDFDSLNNNL